MERVLEQVCHRSFGSADLLMTLGVWEHDSHCNQGPPEESALAMTSRTHAVVCVFPGITGQGCGGPKGEHSQPKLLAEGCSHDCR